MSIRIIFSGGGTGGHIFPAISVADRLRQLHPDAEILFVGAHGGMEMRLVPQHHYEIRGVTVSGLMRSFSPQAILKNLAFPFKLWKGLREARAIVREFRPQLVAGFGGYASGPIGKAAVNAGIPLVLCEANAYPGITNKWLAPKASRILLGNEAALRFFDPAKARSVGNPVRSTLLGGTREKGLALYGLDPSRPVVLSLGGSLGAGTMNNALEGRLQEFLDSGAQLLWQCGKRYHEALSARVPKHPGLRLLPFIEDMAATYACADLVLSRAGASTLSELILLNKPSVLIPSPFVAEDHQTKNAMSFVDKGAAVLVKDAEAAEKLVPETLAILQSPERLAALRQGIENMEKLDSATIIVEEILALIRK